jgi:hypothetical protein
MKDPAFLFYSDNFLSGTMFFTDEQVGKYIRLLCAQHQSGHLEEKHMIFMCKGYDEDIFKKFIKDDAGKYYNERLEMEITKRKNYSESRSNNKKGKIKQPIIISKSYDNHMGNGNGNGNEIEEEILIEKGITKGKNKFIPPTLDQLIDYCNERQNNVDPVKWFNFYTAKNWMIGKNKMSNWKAAVRTWEDNTLNIPANGKQQSTVNGKQSNSGVSEAYKADILRRLHAD